MFLKNVKSHNIPNVINSVLNTNYLIFKHLFKSQSKYEKYMAFNVFDHVSDAH